MPALLLTVITICVAVVGAPVRYVPELLQQAVLKLIQGRV
jgi:hypothetical protein